jgi:hypothetical protein
MAGMPVYAHHAMEYIETESYSTSRRGEFVFHLHYDYMVEDQDDATQDHWELTPGLAYGITDRLMSDVHVHYAKFENGHVVEARRAEFEPDGPSPFLEAAAFTLQYRVTEGGWLDVGVLGTFEIPFDRARDLLDSDEVYEGTLVLAKDFAQHINVTLNLTYGREGDEEYKEYALAAKAPLTGDAHGIAAGLEVLGDFDHFSDTWSFLPGVYLPVGSPQTVFKTGIEMGQGLDNTRANVTLMYRF